MAIVWLFLSMACWAEPLETAFFKVETPAGWEVSRNPSGLWTLTQSKSPKPYVQFSVARLNSTPETYLRSHAALWSRLGVVENADPLNVKHSEQAWFLVKHSADDWVTLKWIRWSGKTLVVSNFRCPESELENHKVGFSEIAKTLELHTPEFSEESLKDSVKQFLGNHQDTPKGLQDPVLCRTTMAAIRQDWEPYFDADVPALYRAYVAYLEARFDAAFAAAHGQELGIGPDLVKARFQSVLNRRVELDAALRGEFPSL